MTALDPDMERFGEVLLYQTEDGRTRIECRFEDETLWLSQGLMAELFQTTPQNITLHLRTLYEEGEISEPATCKEYLQVRFEGARQVRRSIRHYNLDAILAVGYRVRSQRGIQFRQWATERLREYLVKGFTMDDERLRNPPVEGSGVPDYFDELLERIRDIRASERRMYLRVKEIFALAADYQPSGARSTRCSPGAGARCSKQRVRGPTSRRWSRLRGVFLRRHVSPDPARTDAGA